MGQEDQFKAPGCQKSSARLSNMALNPQLFGLYPVFTMSLSGVNKHKTYMVRQLNKILQNAYDHSKYTPYCRRELVIVLPSSP